MQRRPWPTLTGHPCPNLFPRCKSEGNGVGEKETQSSQAKRLYRKASGPDPPTIPLRVPLSIPATWEQVWLEAPTAAPRDLFPPSH